MYGSIITILAAVAAASAKVIDIDVGEGGALAFKPNSTTAAMGDSLHFHFYPESGPHSVVSSTFENPCAPDTNAFFSGYIMGNDSGNDTFVVNVTSTDPMWYYCSLKMHCKAGMVGVINPPSTGNNLQAYAAAASSATVSRPVSTATAGGALTTVMESASTTGSSSSASMTGSSSASMTGSASSRASSIAGNTGTSVSSAAASATSAATGGAQNVKPAMVGLGAGVAGLVAMMV